MRKFLFITIVLSLAFSIFAQTTQNENDFDEVKIKKLYHLPDNLPKPDEAHILQNILAGTESGLYKIIGNDTPEPLWTEGRVTQIVETVVNGQQVWFFVTGKEDYLLRKFK